MDLFIYDGSEMHTSIKKPLCIQGALDSVEYQIESRVETIGPTFNETQNSAQQELSLNSRSYFSHGFGFEHIDFFQADTLSQSVSATTEEGLKGHSECPFSVVNTETGSPRIDYVVDFEIYYEMGLGQWIVDSSRFTCPFPGCSSARPSFCALKVHMKYHEPGRKCSHICAVCSMVLYSFGSLKSHMTNHQQSNVVGYPCTAQDCRKNFATTEGLRLHTRNYHETNKAWNCAVGTCNSAFVRKTDLSLHLIRMHMHTEERLYPCRIRSCSKSFASNAELRRHVAHFHSLSQLKGLNKMVFRADLPLFVKLMLIKSKEFRDKRDKHMGT